MPPKKKLKGSAAPPRAPRRPRASQAIRPHFNTHTTTNGSQFTVHYYLPADPAVPIVRADPERTYNIVGDGETSRTTIFVTLRVPPDKYRHLHRSWSRPIETALPLTPATSFLTLTYRKPTAAREPPQINDAAKGTTNADLDDSAIDVGTPVAGFLDSPGRSAEPGTGVVVPPEPGGHFQPSVGTSSIESPAASAQQRNAVSDSLRPLTLRDQSGVTAKSPFGRSTPTAAINPLQARAAEARKHSAVDSSEGSGHSSTSPVGLRPSGRVGQWSGLQFQQQTQPLGRKVPTNPVLFERQSALVAKPAHSPLIQAQGLTNVDADHQVTTLDLLDSLPSRTSHHDTGTHIASGSEEADVGKTNVPDGRAGEANQRGCPLLASEHPPRPRPLSAFTPVSGLPRRLVVKLKLPIGYTLNENMAPTRDPSDVSGVIKDIVDDLYDVQSKTHGFIPETQNLLIDKIGDMAEKLATLKDLTDPQINPNNPIHDVRIAPEIVDYVDDGRNPDIFTREFVENVQRGNSVINGKKQAFRDFSVIFAKALKQGIGGVDKHVDQIMENAGLEQELDEAMKKDKSKGTENGAE
ncbi:uncharacterized protein HMPREF1541_09306 [Cyphellophora europaea CBS 101466]|uniref:Uncharacterized protein n=1 Tax=Cyphellophora europaea (strain CBS 101466) TaxID=1220924 RepID=W2SC33_CYPE1|nr:uncharacterized protein HMPREF1541_09306 [Cyphellophora europaea CBS 101466]ETN45474.1 hypothetical protein HMPREF1541_09306 [Cyphellophora europaea CBS 101466]